MIEELYQLYLAHPEVTTDSRRCPAGCMFFALRGDNFDGNRFAAQALEAGAAVAVVDDATVIPHGDDRYFLVPDTLLALQQLAAHHRRRFQGPVLQVTGTNGKTTTKELLAAVLGMKYHVLYTQGNLNNHIGVPLTLLRLRPGQHDFAIIETGANHPGEIAQLTQIVQPDCGLVTNVGRAHLQGFGSFDGVKRTKGELYDYLKAHQRRTHLFANASDPDLMAMLAERDIPLEGPFCHFYCHAGYAPTQAMNIWCQGSVIDANPLLRLVWATADAQEHEVQTNLIGDYNLDNVLAAICAGLCFEVPATDINEALATYQPTLGRSEFRRTEHNELIIDAYNANLTSMQSALRNFRRITHPQKMVILGDMRELGDETEAAHLRVAADVIGSDVAVVWTVGEAFARAFARLPLPQGFCLRTFPDVEALKRHLTEEPPQGALILIKGSNSTRLHQLPDLL